jgi:hypothetical protein
VVRNRLIVALMGLWKIDANLGMLESAITEAKTALTAGYPKGCDIIARFCITRETLRDVAVNPNETLDRLIADSGGDQAPGTALAIAALLALDVADRASFEHFRELIVKNHTEYPMMWTFSSFLLDRHHSYWLFQVPFTAGWSYGHREGFFLTKGDTEDANRILKTELHTADGKPFRIPEDLDSEWTMIVFSMPPPWMAKREEVLPPSPGRVLQSLSNFAATRPQHDVKVILASMGGDAAATRTALDSSKIKLDCATLTVPGGIENPLLRRLGILSEDDALNSVLVRRDGRIAIMISGLLSKDGGAGTLGNVITQEDEKFVVSALDRGETQVAKDRIMALAPPYDPDAVDARGKKLPKPKYNFAHLRARARVYVALKEWDKALADAEEVVQHQLGTDGGMSLRTLELDEAEQLRDSIRKSLDQAKESR